VKSRNRTYTGQINGMVPSKGYNLASGALFHMKLTEDIEQKLRKTMLALFGHQSGFTQVKRIKRLFLAELEKTIVTKRHFSRKERLIINCCASVYRY